MSTRKRIVRKDPSQKTIVLEAEREADFLFGRVRGQALGFADFIRSHGVISLAVGIIFGTAVTVLVKSLVEDVLNPLIGLVLPGKNLSTATFQVASATIGWGNFVSTLLNFLLVALSVYILFKVLKLEKFDTKKDSKK